MAQTGSLKEELDEINHKFLDSEELLDTGVQHEFSKTFTGITSVLSWSDQQDRGHGSGGNFQGQIRS